MCHFASFVLTKDRAFFSDASDSHEEIIREHKLHADGAKGSNVLRVEIRPGGFADLKTWAYRIDQDVLPEWHDPKADEKRARAALAKRLSAPYWRAVFRFVRGFDKIPWCKPDGKPDAAWKLYRAPTLAAACGAAYDAAYDAARGAARGAACDAAYDACGAAYDAAYGAACDAAYDAAYGAARGAACGAARDAARGAACDAAHDAARGAACDAALYSDMLILGDGLDQKHRDHIIARWRVWQKGYCLLCDVDGVLYVYAADGAAQ